MKKYAERFLYHNLASPFDLESLRNFLLGSYVTCDPIIKSLILQGELDLLTVQHYIYNIVEKSKQNGETCFVAVDQISGAVVGCLIAFTLTNKKGAPPATENKGKQMKEELIQLFPPDMLAHRDLYQTIFSGASLGGGDKPMCIVNVTVSPLYRNQGVATKLVEELMKASKKAKLCDSMFVVSTGNGKVTSNQNNGHNKPAKNQSPTHELFSSPSLKFSPLNKLPYSKVNKNPSKYSEGNLPNGLMYTGQHSALTLLRFKIDKSVGSDEEGTHREERRARAMSREATSASVGGRTTRRGTEQSLFPDPL